MSQGRRGEAAPGRARAQLRRFEGWLAPGTSWTAQYFLLRLSLAWDEMGLFLDFLIE